MVIKSLVTIVPSVVACAICGAILCALIFVMDAWFGNHSGGFFGSSRNNLKLAAVVGAYFGIIGGLLLGIVIGIILAIVRWDKAL